MRVTKYKTPDQAFTTVMGNPGRKFTKAVWIDSPIRLRRLKNADAANFSYDMPDYPADRAARLMIKAGKTLGITQGAKRFLQAALAPKGEQA